MNKKERNPISVRLTKDVAEKFRNLAQQNNVSQSDFIEILLKRFEETQYYDELTDSMIVNQRLQLLLSKNNNLTDVENKKYVKPMKLCFNGHYRYFIPQQRRILRKAKLYEEELRKEFEINTSLDDFLLYDSIDIAFDSDKGKYVVIEAVGLRRENEMKFELYINRCYYARDLEDIKSKFHGYVDESDVRGIEIALAEPVKSEEDLLLFQ